MAATFTNVGTPVSTTFTSGLDGATAYGVNTNAGNLTFTAAITCAYVN